MNGLRSFMDGWKQVERKRKSARARMEREVELFFKMHPDAKDCYPEIVRLIKRYDCTLEGAYRVASNRMPR